VKKLGLLMASLLAVAACDEQCGYHPEPAEDHGPMAEGIYAPLGQAVPYATDEQRATFARGLAVGEHRFNLEEGLGPAFNVTFCLSCHEKPMPGGSSGLYRNFFLTGVRDDQGAFFPGMSAGMSGGVIRMYYYGDEEPARPVVPDNINVISQRNAIPFHGVGLIAAIADDVILANEDPDDLDGDGISGRANYDRGFVGRFGRKSQTVSIEGFIRGPLFNHLGVTSDPLTDEQRAELPVDSSGGEDRSAAVYDLAFQSLLRFSQAAAPDGPLTDDDDAADPEMTTSELFDLVSFAMLLAPPEPEPLTDQTRLGLKAFDAAMCARCHVPRLDSPRGPLPLYSDLLLHDMGEDLADGLEQKEATGSEFRTQPLWGVTAVGPYLHDGRAATLDDAIRMHGGEGEASAKMYAAMDDTTREALLEFLRSLGGRDQKSTGLLPPNTPLAGVGEYGGPTRELNATEEERFLAGRTAFDHEFNFADGAGGPRMNGDSCRACHFEPSIGGAGPRGVNVMRHGIKTEQGDFVPPGVGTILHKETSMPESVNRPQAECNVFEHRQTPALFGLGLLDSLSDDDIIANADPDDVDGDGISGKVSYADGGRVGRFGWKANVPSLAEFVRDGVAMELGLTLPLQDGLTFGKVNDNDDIPDPEVDLEFADQLLDFMEMLGPPPGHAPSDADAAARGETLMDTVGCTACHIPALGTDGPRAFTDLLLHDMLPDGADDIEDASATVREFRTAPLWGISDTAPYLHSGAADTLDQAIRMHDGEAAASRDDYQGLTDDERADLIEFLMTL
jgi:CxxC motif-containing protein (DUF1111 family)